MEPYGYNDEIYSGMWERFSSISLDLAQANQVLARQEMAFITTIRAN